MFLVLTMCDEEVKKYGEQMIREDREKRKKREKER